MVPGLHNEEKEVTRPLARFKPNLPENSEVEGTIKSQSV